MPQNILAIVGSYRPGGVIHQAVDAVLSAARQQGATTECVDLRDLDIDFCTNCRVCTQQPGSSPGACPIRDEMTPLIAKIEAADALVLASPVNCGTVTALFKRFQERLVCFAYWPWGQPAPKMRHEHVTRPAVLITSSAMPGLMARLTTGILRSLKQTAETVGTKPVGSLSIGMAASRPDQRLSERQQARAQALGHRLAAKNA